MNSPKSPISRLIRYCPACGGETFRPNSEKSFHCSTCDFILYFNAAAAVAAIIESEEEILLVVRGKSPGLGLLDLPGGFVDHHETAEAALAREVKEELGLDLSMELGWNDRNPMSGLESDRHPLTSCYLGSYPNTYPYKSVTYQSTDMFYHILLKVKPELEAKDDVSGLIWVPRNAVPIEKIAFASIRNILIQYQNTLNDCSSTLSH